MDYINRYPYTIHGSSWISQFSVKFWDVPAAADNKALKLNCTHKSILYRQLKKRGSNKKEGESWRSGIRNGAGREKKLSNDPKTKKKRKMLFSLFPFFMRKRISFSLSLSKFLLAREMPMFSHLSLSLSWWINGGARDGGRTTNSAILC